MSMEEQYIYKCLKCEHEYSYHVHGGVKKRNYYEDTEKREERFKQEVEIGKYGKLIKSIIEADVDKELTLSCSDELFQCQKCYGLYICPERRISSAWESGSDYAVDIKFKVSCPSCECEEIKRIYWYDVVKCPSCKDGEMELVSFGEECGLL